MSFILHFANIEDDDRRVRVGEVRRAEYVVLLDGDQSLKDLEEFKKDAVHGFEFRRMVEVDEDFSLLPTEIPLVSST